MLNADRLIPGFLILVFSLFFYLFEFFDYLLLSIIISLVIFELFSANILQLKSYLPNFILIIFIFLIFFLDNFGFSNYLTFIFILFISCSFFYSKYRNNFFNFTILLFIYFLFEILTFDRFLFYKLIFISFFNDTTAFIFGKLLKGPKIIKSISPNKTWSGTLISFLLSFLVLIYFNFNYFTSFLISLSLFFGDLYFSFIKRKNNIKDFSNIFKGHGGILDRIDSVFLSSFIVFSIFI